MNIGMLIAPLGFYNGCWLVIFIDLIVDDTAQVIFIDLNEMASRSNQCLLFKELSIWILLEISWWLSSCMFWKNGFLLSSGNSRPILWIHIDRSTLDWWLLDQCISSKQNQVKRLGNDAEVLLFQPNPNPPVFAFLTGLDHCPVGKIPGCRWAYLAKPATLWQR